MHLLIQVKTDKIAVLYFVKAYKKYFHSICSKLLCVCEKITSEKFPPSKNCKSVHLDNYYFFDIMKQNNSEFLILRLMGCDYMRIAICDDERALLDSFSTVIGQRYGESMEVFLCESAQELINVVKDKSFDMAFIDIVLPDMDGIKAAKVLCENNTDIKVVFITAYVLQYAEEIFLGLKPYGFIGKPIPDDKVYYYIDRLAAEKQRKANRLQITRGGIQHDILMSDIIYIESDKRLANIQCSDEIIAAYEKLDELEKRLDDRFVRCHQSYIINLEHVVRMNTESMVMKNGTEIKISRTRIAETRRCYFEYKGRSVL